MTASQRSLTVLAALALLAQDARVVGRGFAGRGGARAGGVSAGGRTGGAVVGPYGGAGSASRSRSSVVGPAGWSGTAGAGRGSYTTSRGSTINYAGAGAGVRSPWGGAAGRGIGGVQVTTPGGQSYTRAGTAGGAIGPGGNAAVRGSSVGVVSGPGGSAARVSRGGAVVGPSGAVAGRTTAGGIRGPAGGVVAGGGRWGVAAGPYGMAGYTARGGVAGRYGTYYVGGAALRTQGAYVRQAFAGYPYFTPTWWRAHPGCWRPVGWAPAMIWTSVAWPTLVTACRFPVQPIFYDYGTTIVYEDDQVYDQGEPIATAAQYADQAQQLAAQGQQAQPAEGEEWMALGVFGMVQGEATDANDIFQLAINKQGVIRGNYYNALTDATLPVYGSVDRQSQRAAWTVDERKDTAYETGIANLTQPETTMLVHFGKERTQQWTLVRLDAPDDQK